jgi:hypothetical protein
LIDYSKQFSELIDKVGEVIVPSIEKEFEKFGMYYHMSFLKAVRLHPYQERIMKLPEFIEMVNQIQDSGILDPLFHVTSRKGWVELALIDYIASTDAYRSPPEDVYPTREEIEKTARRLNNDLIVGIPKRRAFAIVDRTILSLPCIELDDEVRLRYMSLFEVQSIKHSDFYDGIELPQFTIDGSPSLVPPCLIEYRGSELDKMDFEQIRDHSVQRLAGNIIQDVAMCLRLYRDTNITIGNIWIGLRNWDEVTSSEPRPEPKKAGFPRWEYSRMIDHTGPFQTRMVPKFYEPVHIHREEVDEIKHLWNLFSRYRNEPATGYHKYYQTALIQYNRLIAEDSPDIAANALSSAIDAFGRDKTNRSIYKLLITLLAYGDNRESINQVINDYQRVVRDKIEHGERIDEDNYQLVYKMGNCFRLALNHALFLYEKFGVFKSRRNFHNIVLDNQQDIADIIPSWIQKQLGPDFNVYSRL